VYLCREFEVAGVARARYGAESGCSETATRIVQRRRVRHVEYLRAELQAQSLGEPSWRIPSSARNEGGDNMGRTNRPTLSRADVRARAR
jgi:hypothetical protein